jgi:hypothetical protein
MKEPALLRFSTRYSSPEARTPDENAPDSKTFRRKGPFPFELTGTQITLGPSALFTRLPPGAPPI